MAYKCDIVQDAPATIWTPLEGWNWDTDMPEVNDKLNRIWEASDVPMFHIVDLKEYLLDMDGLVKGSANAGFGPGALYSHPNLKEVIIVTSQEALIAAAKQMNSTPEVYQTVYIHIMSTLQEALDYVRAQS